MKRFFPLVVVLSGAPVWAQDELSVRVVDTAGAPIAGAQVQVRMWVTKPPFLAPKATDTSGMALFSLPALPGSKPAGASVVAGAKGFAFNSAKAVEDKAEVRLERGVAWRGKVVDEAGKPLAGVKIALYGAMEERDFRSSIFLPDEAKALVSLYSTQSQADGSFVIAHVPATKQLFYRATRQGYSLEESQGAQADVIEKIQLARAGSLRGRMLDVEGKPIANLWVFAFGDQDMGGMGHNRVKADANGVFLIGHLAPGIYDISAEVPENGPYLLTKRTRQRVVVGKIGEVGVWRAQRGVVIHGMVRDAATQKPLAGVSLAAATKQDVAKGNESKWGTSDATGHFALRVLPGKYRVRLGGPTSGYVDSNVQFSVEVDAQGKQSGPELNFALKQASVVRGVTLDERGQPIKARLTTGDIFGFSIESDEKGRFEYMPRSPRELTFGGGSDDSGYFEVVSPKKVELPATGLIPITVRYKPWLTLAGRVVTPEGTPIEGVRVDGRFTELIGDRGGIGGQSRTTSDKAGRYMLTRLRDSRQKNVEGTEIEVSGKKDGYEFQRGGEVSRNGDTISVNDLVFVALGGKIEGTTQAGAQVVVAGRETRADADGHFAFAALPNGQNTVFAAKDGNFGSAPAKTPLAIKLQPLRAQGQDQELAEQMWADLQRELDDDTMGLKEWLTPPAFEEAMKAAQATGQVHQIAEVAARWQKGDSLEVLRGGLETITQPDQRADNFLQAALATNDAGLMKRALEESEAIFKGPTISILWREPQLYRAAVLRERLNGAEDGRLAMSRALAYTLQNHPEKSRIEGAMRTQVGRNEALYEAIPIAAQGSPAMLREVLDSIDDGSGFEMSALAQAIPVVAKTHGFVAVEPLLKELKTAPTPTLDTERGYSSFDRQWAYGQAVHDIISLIGLKNPAKALELARGVEEGQHGDEQRARALASAAKFQTLTVAAALYREAVKTIGTDDAPRIAATVWERDPKLGLELFGIARQKTEEAMKNPFPGINAWIPFAFYFARVNPAQSRLILEREWSKSLRAKVDDDELASIALAMSPVDARRAMELARQLPGGWSEGTRDKIARFVFADQATRQGFVLNRIGAREAWDPGSVQW
ncbi:hypothetical protein IAD21_04904 [Abditibacteriota bacterium]|nr:hypothetical protein IAD21_04904 [Abditibacteriota bacterium]